MQAPLKFTPVIMVARASVAMASCIQRATALSLVLYCGELRNGGVIRNCKGWSKNQWRAACGVEQVPKSCELYYWDGDDLHVTIYDRDAEAHAFARAAAARAASRKRWGLHADEKPPLVQQVVPETSQEAQSSHSSHITPEDMDLLQAATSRKEQK